MNLAVQRVRRGTSLILSSLIYADLLLGLPIGAVEPPVVDVLVSVPAIRPYDVDNAILDIDISARLVLRGDVRTELLLGLPVNTVEVRVVDIPVSGRRSPLVHDMDSTVLDGDSRVAYTRIRFLHYELLGLPVSAVEVLVADPISPLSSICPDHMDFATLDGYVRLSLVFLCKVGAYLLLGSPDRCTRVLAQEARSDE